jgi:hypothetical protein
LIVADCETYQSHFDGFSIPLEILKFTHRSGEPVQPLRCPASPEAFENPVAALKHSE